MLISGTTVEYDCKACVYVYVYIYIRKHTEEGHTGKITTFCQEKSYLEMEELDGNLKLG